MFGLFFLEKQASIILDMTKQVSKTSSVEEWKLKRVALRLQVTWVNFMHIFIV